MKYYNIAKRKHLPNGEIDKFLSQLHVLCKKYRMTLCTVDKKYPLIVKDYSMENVKHMLGNVQNGLGKTPDDEDQQSTQNTNGNSNSKR